MRLPLKITNLSSSSLHVWMLFHFCTSKWRVIQFFSHSSRGTKGLLMDTESRTIFIMVLRVDSSCDVQDSGTILLGTSVFILLMAVSTCFLIPASFFYCLSTFPLTNAKTAPSTSDFVGFLTLPLLSRGWCKKPNGNSSALSSLPALSWPPLATPCCP